MKRSHHPGRMAPRGVTLVELVVVITIIGILAAALGFTFQGWLDGYRMESAVRGLYTDMMNTRALAMRQNMMYFMTFVDATHYSARSDNNDSTTPDAGDPVLPLYPKEVQYELAWDGAAPANQTISFDKRGIIHVVGLDPFPAPDPVITITAPAGIDPDYDCIVISQTRMKMGKWDRPLPGVCNEK